MYLRINFNNGVTVHQQIVDQVTQMAAGGALRLGDRLPTVREMASELVVNPNTVARAYQELERRGIVQARRGLGTFIADPVQTINHIDRRDTAIELLDSAFSQAARLGLKRREIEQIAAERIDEWFDKE